MTLHRHIFSASGIFPYNGVHEKYISLAGNEKHG